MIDKHQVITQLRGQGLSLEDAVRVADELDRRDREGRPATRGELAAATRELRQGAAAESERLQQEISEGSRGVAERIRDAETRLGSQITATQAKTEELRNEIRTSVDTATTVDRRRTGWTIAAAVAAAATAGVITQLVINEVLPAAQQLLR